MASTNQPVTPGQAIQIGMEHFQAGRLPQAEAIFRQMLAVDDTNPMVLDLLGCIAHQAGKYKQALGFFNQALQHNPNDPYLHFNLGISLEEQGRLDEALAHFRKVIILKPDHAKAHNQLGKVLQQLGMTEEALGCYQSAVSLAPNFAEAHNNLGAALQALDRAKEAAVCHRKALALSPDYPEAHNNLGTALQRLGKADEALACYRKALQLNPNYAVAHNNLGNLFQELNRPDEALSCYRKALALKPGYAKAHNNLGVILQKLGKPQEALDCYRQALTLTPAYAEALNNLGSALQELGKPDEAQMYYQQALQLDPALSKAQWNLSLSLLLHGDLAAGLPLYEKRFEGADDSESARSRATLARLSAKPRWQGEDLRGKNLLVWTEQGLGDSLMMLRYLSLFRDKGAGSILVACQPKLVKIMQTLPAVDRVIGDGASLPLDDFDCHCPMMSLPYLFGTGLDTIPNAVPYISVPPAMTEKWAQRLAAIKEMKVGLVWAGSKTQKKDYLRSIPFQALAPLLALPGVQFVSLQKGESENHVALLDWMAECEDFMDTAALMQQLDLVISVDTAAAHLAGALGRPVWLLNRFESEWRWMLEREDSPWYPTMRIFRQPALHDWGSVVQRVARELAALPPA